MKINPKMCFWRAKQGLRKTWDLKTKLVSFVRRANREGREEKKKREKKRKRKRKKMEEPRSSKKVWNFIFCMDHMEF